MRKSLPAAAAITCLALAGCGTAPAASRSASPAAPVTSCSARVRLAHPSFTQVQVAALCSPSALPAADLQADVTIHGQGLTVTWNMPASVTAGTQISGAALSNTTGGPDMYVLEMSTSGAAATLAAQMGNDAGPYADANGNSVGSVSVTVGGSEIIVSTDSTPAMTDFLNSLKANS